MSKYCTVTGTWPSHCEGPEDADQGAVNGTECKEDSGHELKLNHLNQAQVLSSLVVLSERMVIDVIVT